MIFSQRNRTMMILAAACLVGAHARAADWPMWGGSLDRNMASKEKGMPVNFDPGKLKPRTDIVDPATTKNVRWVVKMGSQTYGNPTVANGRVFVGTNNDGRKDPRFQGDFSLLHCIDEKTGEILWTLTVPKLGTGKVGDWEFLGICSSPTIEDNRVYIVTNRCEVLCLDVNGMADGNDGDFQDEGKYMAVVETREMPPLDVKPTDADILWRYDMRTELGVFPHNITSTSLMIVGDLVYTVTSNGVDWGHTNIPAPQAPIYVALDKMTGELRGEEASGVSQTILHGCWTSLAYAEFNGKGQVILADPNGVLRSFDPKPVPDPQDAEFNIFKQNWTYDANPPHYRMKDGKPIRYPRPDGPSEFIATPVVYNNRIYVAIGQDPEHGEGVGNLVCVDPTGKRVWNFDKINRSMSTVAIADGLLYIGDFSGFIYCLDAETGEHYWTHDSLSHIWGSPLVADGKVYIGTEDGDLFIFEASRGKDGKPVVLNTVNMNDPIYSSPVAANGVLYIATPTQLYAIEGGTVQ